MFKQAPTYIILWYLMILLPSYVRSFNVTFKYGSTTSILIDHVCSINDTIEDANLDSDLHCSYSCTSDVTCRSFFYHHNDKKCVTCDDVYLDTSTLAPYKWMAYYILENEMASIDRWNKWSAWSLCSATCLQGTRTRTRTCKKDTLGTCTGDSLQNETCNEYSCTPLANNCADWAIRGFNETRDMMVDPDGGSTIFSGVNVYCDLASEPGKALTVLHHDNEQRTLVDGYEVCGSYEVVFTYAVGLEAAQTIADKSSGCSQYVKWDCHKANLSWPEFTPTCTAWKNRNMIKSTYFTGPHSSGKYCQCGDQGNCINPMLDCNCDEEVEFETLDDGKAIRKSDLPIYSFTAGDTGGPDEYGYHTVGPLICW